MMSRLEKNVVKNIMNTLDKHYPGFYFKVHGGPYQVSGIPDIIGLHRGQFIGIEVKRPKGSHGPSKKQLQIITKINAAGGIAFVADNPEDVLKELDGTFNDVTRNKEIRSKRTKR